LGQEILTFSKVKKKKKEGKKGKPKGMCHPNSSEGEAGKWRDPTSKGRNGCGGDPAALLALALPLAYKVAPM
jgi:hypothetical protein